MNRTACFPVCLIAAVVSGCGVGSSDLSRLDAVWGRRGISEGRQREPRFQKPRAMAIDHQDRIYIVDMTARIQVFDTGGGFLRTWQTPASKAGKPTGLSIGIDGNLLVADTHYYRVLIYSPAGDLIRTIPKEDPVRPTGRMPSREPGRFGLVTDVVQDSRGNYYVAEKGEYDRIQKFSPTGQFLLQWGGHGSQPGQFANPQSLAVDEDDRIWVADACNHRIQVFDTEGKFLWTWGTEGSGPGRLYYPYDLVLGDDGTVYVCEFGNHRVQKLTRREGRSLGCWGTHGRDDGQLYNPWALVRDGRGRIHVLDTNNHRVQRVKM